MSHNAPLITDDDHDPEHHSNASNNPGEAEREILAKVRSGAA